MGGKSKSSSSSSNTTNTSTSVTTKNLALDGVEGIALADASNNSITVLDGGAIDHTFGAVGHLLDVVETINAQSLSAVQGTATDSLDSVTENMISSFEKINESNKSDQVQTVEKLGLYAVVGVGFVVGLALWSRV